MEGPLFITGGSGFVGHHVVSAARERDLPVRALVRPTSQTSGLAGVDLVVGDLATGRGLRAGVAGAGVVIHLAGLTKALDASEFFEVNAEGTRRLVRACRGATPRPRRFVLVSSLSAAGPSRYGRPLVEDDPPRPVSYYGRSKLAAERIAVEEAGDELEVVIVRPPAVYGPRDRENAAFLDTLSAGFAARFRGALERLSLVEVGDLAEAILLAAKAPRAAGRTYFACHPEVLSLEEMLGTMAAELGVKPRSITLPGAVVRIAGLVSHAVGRAMGQAPMLSRMKVPELLARDWSCSPARIREELGFVARTSVAEGVKPFVRWYREQAKT
jgi:dihydroflavonol-4-reductase